MNAPTGTLDPTLDTFPKLVRRNAERFGARVAIREKDLGIWQSHTWRDYFERGRRIALFSLLGFTLVVFTFAGTGWLPSAHPYLRSM